MGIIPMWNQLAVVFTSSKHFLAHITSLHYILHHVDVPACMRWTCSTNLLVYVPLCNVYMSVCLSVCVFVCSIRIISLNGGYRTRIEALKWP